MRGGGAAHRRSVSTRAVAAATTTLSRSGSLHHSSENTHLRPTLPPLLHPRHDVRCHRDGRVGAQLSADTAEAGRTGVRLLGALSGRGSRDEPGMGDC